MRKWKKIALAVVVAVIVAVVAVMLSIDGIAMRAVTRASSQTLGVETSLRTLTLGFIRGDVKLTGLKVKNPEGFETDHFLKMDESKVAVSVGSLMGDKVVVPIFELKGIDVNLEKKGGKANYDVILANLKSQDKQDKNAQPGKKFVINDLLISGVTVHADVLPIGGKATRVNLSIPEIRLKNVGSDSDTGATLAEVTSQVTKAIFAAIMKAGGSILPADLMGDLGKEMAGLKDMGKLGVEVLGQVGGDLGKIGGDVGKVGGDAGKEVGKAMEGFGGLIPKSEPKK